MIRSAILILFAVVVSEAMVLRNPQWIQFKKAHGKSYATVEEEKARFFIFMNNLREIQEHNKEFEAGKKSFSLKMNQFGDMTNEEFRATMNGLKAPKNLKANQLFYQPANTQIPDSVDWRTQGYVTEVKDQKQCGSCWSFSATGGLEGQHFKQTGKLVSLSEQNLVDCSWGEGNEGCNGGWMDSAFTYIQKNSGIDTESSYPYEAKDGRCRYADSNIGANDTGFVDIKSGSESDLENAIATIGPISVAIDASRMSFQFYNSGVYDEPRCKNGLDDLDHGVLAVGYGTNDQGVKYYIVKNSWGLSYGDNGYILMSREKSNQCGIATAASYPTVKF
jgi:cathepsin L